MLKRLQRRADDTQLTALTHAISIKGQKGRKNALSKSEFRLAVEAAKHEAWLEGDWEERNARGEIIRALKGRKNRNVSRDDTSSISSDAISYESDATSISSSNLSSSTTPSTSEDHSSGETDSITSYSSTDSDLDSQSEAGDSLPESIQLVNFFDSSSVHLDLPSFLCQLSLALVFFSLLKSSGI